MLISSSPEADDVPVLAPLLRIRDRMPPRRRRIWPKGQLDRQTGRFVRRSVLEVADWMKRRRDPRASVQQGTAVL